MFCPKCGTQLPDGSRFCGKCGAQLADAAQPAAAPEAAPAVPQTPPDFGSGTPVVPGGAPQKSKGKVGLIVAAVAAVVVVALAIWGVVSCAGRGGGRGSAQSIADGVTASYNTMIEGNFSADSMQKGVNDLIDLMPQQAVEYSLNEQGITREELNETMMTTFEGIEDYTSLTSLVDFKFQASVGAPLSGVELADVNERLNAAGMNVNVTEGNHISYVMTMDAFGQQSDQSLDESGLYAINVNGSWYLWGAGGL